MKKNTTVMVMSACISVIGASEQWSVPWDANQWRFSSGTYVPTKLRAAWMARLSPKAGAFAAFEEIRGGSAKLNTAMSESWVH